jgi:serine/threonine-protein kinase
MSISPGTRLGVYEVKAQIGAGGMGEVYRARDTMLGRDVALKVLPTTVAGDPERLARFEREARTLAALNHPHVAQIHGMEHGAIVMELVEGEDLAERIARGPIPIDEALPIARQIAEALDAAHTLGIVHRDLKPANIKVRADGAVKVLDFGLAKAIDRSSGHGPDAAGDPTQSPTVTSPAMMTGVGMILGTAAYMSPEQAKGREADRRSDIWAFGVVLYEMLTGRRAFDGADMADVLGAVVRLEPAWEALPSDLPPAIRTLLQSCLIKDRGRRVADISTALFVLDKAPSLAKAPASAAPAPSGPLWRRVMPRAAGAIVIAVGAGTAVWVATRPAEPVPPPVSRLQIATPGPTALTVNGNDRDLAITPDGSHVVYVGNNGTQLFVRALDALEPVAVFTGAPRGPFVSPDSQWIGFVDNNTTLKKVAMTGGPAVTLTTLDNPAPRGATWGPQDTIIFATSRVTTGLQRVGAAGGPTTVITRPDRAQGEADHLWPELLPGGRAVMFTITMVTGGLDAAQVAVEDLQTGKRTVLVRGGSQAHYVTGGNLVYAAAGALRAVPFDLARLETRGTPVPVVTEVVTTVGGAIDAVVSADGTLAYVPGGVVAGATRTLVWVDRHGGETPIPAPPRAYVYPRLSPDGTRVAVYATDQELDLWVWDLGRATFARVTFDPGVDAFPVWSPDGRRVIFSSDRAGAWNLFRLTEDGTGAVERLSEGPNPQYAGNVSPDGRLLIFTEETPTTGDDVMQLTLDGTRRVRPLVQSPFGERNGVISPDGRWLAYEANDSGRFEIFVRPFPDVNKGHWQVSTAGGTRPVWSRSGQELVYVAATGAIMGVAVGRGQSWVAATPTLMVNAGYFAPAGGNAGRTYDIAPDGQRFLMIKQAGAGQDIPPPRLIVVQNWAEELRRLVPSK